MKQNIELAKRFGHVGLVALFAVGLAFTDVAPANALAGDLASGDFVKSIAHIEVPVEEEVNDFTIERPNLIEVTGRTWKCPEGYTSTENPISAKTQCFIDNKGKATQAPTNGKCGTGFKLVTDQGKQVCQKPESAFAEVKDPGTAKYECPVGFVPSGSESGVTENTHCVHQGSESTRTVIKTCSGVLIDQQTIVSLSQCLLPGDPNQKLFDSKVSVNKINQGTDPVSGRTLGPAKITFGTDTLPGPEHTYWANSARAEGSTQLMAIRTDRPVDKNDGTPVKPAVNTVHIGDALKIAGWSESAGKPQLLAADTTAGLPYLVNYTQRDPRFLQTNWDDWRKAPKGFNDASTDATIGKVSEPDVRKGYVIDKISMSEDVDLGAPTFNKDGQLAGMYIGTGMFLDLGESRAKEFLYKQAKLTADGKMSLPVPGGAYAAYKQMQNLICQNPGVAVSENTATPNPTATSPAAKPGEKSGEEGSVSADSDMKGEALEGEKRPTGVKEFDENKNKSGHIGGYMGSLKTGSDDTVYRYTNALKCGDSYDKTKPMSIGSAQDWGEFLDNRLSKVMDELQKRSDRAIARRDQAIAERDRYNEALKIMKTGVEGFNPEGYDNCRKFYVPKWEPEEAHNKDKDHDMTEEVARRCLTEMQNSVSPQLINGIDENQEEVIPSLGTWLVKEAVGSSAGKEKFNFDSEGAAIKKYLEGELDTLTVKVQRKTKNAEDEQVKADKLSEEIKKKDSLSNYRAEINKKLSDLTGQTIKVIDKAQTSWKAEADKAYQKFNDDYNGYKKLLEELKSASGDIKSLDAGYKVCDTALRNLKSGTPGSPKDNQAIKNKQAECGKIKDDIGSKKKKLNELLGKSKAEPYQGWSGIPTGIDETTGNLKGEFGPIIPNLKGYRPDHGGANKTGSVGAETSYKASLDAIAALPKYLLYAQYLDRALQGISSDLANKGFKDTGTIAKIHQKIANELAKANQQRDEALADKARIDYTVDALEKKFSNVPERFKKFAKSALEAARGKRQFTTNAINSINDAVAALEKLERESKNAPSTDVAVGYEKETADKVKQIQDSMNTVKSNLKKVSELDKSMDDFVSGKGGDSDTQVIDPKTGKPKTKEQIAQEAAEKERKEKIEEERRQAEKTRREKESAAKLEADKKKDLARLAKALSKNTLRAEGTDRVLTSIAAWKMGKFPGDSLVLVDGNVHADGLSATPFAAALKAPVLLTCWKTGLEPALMDQIKMSGKKRLFLVGGQVPMTPYDEFELRDAGVQIYRIAGSDRFATSVAVNQATEPLIKARPRKPLSLYIGDGIGYPDALVAGAAAGRVGGLMLLSKGNQLDSQTYSYISELGQTRPLKIIAVGGPAARAIKNTPWPTTMSVNLSSIVGRDRYDTAAQLSTTLPGTRAAVLATGQQFPDALSGGSLAVDQNATLVLTKTDELPPSSYQSLQRYGAEKTIVMGGVKAVSAKVAELVNGASLKNPESVTIQGTLADREKDRLKAKEQQAREEKNALQTVRDLIKNEQDLRQVMAELGIGSISDLAKLLNTPAKQSSSPTPTA